MRQPEVTITEHHYKTLLRSEDGYNKMIKTVMTLAKSQIRNAGYSEDINKKAIELLNEFNVPFKVWERESDKSICAWDSNKRIISV